jgi:tRNA(Arg) A34 adenosine deaminase TadA
LAYAAVKEGNRPFAAILVAADGEVLAEGVNIAATTCDPFNHAEINVLRTAHLRHGTERMLNSTLYVNGEPCTMCAGTIIRYGIARVLFALWEKELWPYVQKSSLPISYPSKKVFAMARPRIQVIGGILKKVSKGPVELYLKSGEF